jgi:hypothetical protein
MSMDEQTLQSNIRQANGLMNADGFQESERSKALDAALLSGRATTADVLSFVKLNAALASARAVLETIPASDPRKSVIAERYIAQRAALRDMAIQMDGAVRVAFGL